MDFEKELRNFARSDLPLRQMREDAHFAVRIVMEEKSFDGRLSDLSRGGVGALISGEEPEIGLRYCTFVGLIKKRVSIVRFR